MPAELALLSVPIAAPLPVVRPEPLERLPGSAADDPFIRLGEAWLLSKRSSAATETAYRRDLEAWARFCARIGIHPLAAERFHVDAWAVAMGTEVSARTGKPLSAATVSRRLSALGGLYEYGVRDAQVLTHSPVANVRRPKVSADSQSVGLDTAQLRAFLGAAGEHSPRARALVTLLALCGLRISEALSADVEDFTAEAGHRVLRVIRKGNKRQKIALPAPVVRALEDYLDGRSTGPLFLAGDGTSRYPYASAHDMFVRLAKRSGLPAGVTPHSLRHSYVTEALALSVPLQDVQDACGHSDPRTTRRYDRSRGKLDRSPNYQLASALGVD